jgi:Protein of unknown function (DUF1579)
MSVHESLANLEGKWKGTNRLYLSWLPDPLRESDSTATVSLKANGQFLNIEYTWAYEDKPQQGILLLGCDSKSDAAQAIWTDSWHMSHKFMVCDGIVDGGGNVNVKGFYTVPDHPDWGWRMEIRPDTAAFRLVMYNVSPDGDEELAVDTEYSRA